MELYSLTCTVISLIINYRIEYYNCCQPFRAELSARVNYVFLLLNLLVSSRKFTYLRGRVYHSTVL